MLGALDLSTLLGFYLDRAARYGIFDGDAEREARALLGTLENAYRLRFTKSAPVFDLDRFAADAVEVEGDVEYHLVGHDSIRRLVESAREQGAAVRRDRQGTIGSLASLELRVARRGTAAFLAAPRDRALALAHVEGTGLSELESPPERSAAVAAPFPAPVARPPAPTPPKAGRRVPAEEAPVQLGLQPGEPDVLLGTTAPSPQWGILGEAARCTVGAGSQRDAHDQPLRRTGRRQELHARVHRRDVDGADSWAQPAASTPGDGHLPPQSDPGLCAGVHEHGRREGRPRPGSGDPW